MSPADLRPSVDLPPALASVLRAFAARDRVLVAFDFDGVLAPIVSEPSDARPLAASAEALRRLDAAPRAVVALVSGRALADLRAVASPPPGAVLVGSHGAEVELPPRLAGARAVPGQGGAAATTTAPGQDLDDEAALLLRRVEEALTEIVAAHPGTSVELKPSAAVLHTRGVDREVADAATAAALAGPGCWDGVHAMEGKEVVELAVVRASKGAALRSLRATLGLPQGRGGVLFVGDDVTDETAFRSLDDTTGDVTVKVGDGATAARHRLHGPDDVAAMLTELAAALG